jgi:hypothetical protein
LAKVRLNCDAGDVALSPKLTPGAMHTSVDRGLDKKGREGAPSRLFLSFVLRTTDGCGDGRQEIA